jgi:hypothetical protein
MFVRFIIIINITITIINSHLFICWHWSSTKLLKVQRNKQQEKEEYSWQNKNKKLYVNSIKNQI